MRTDPTEVEVEHAERAAGASKYSVYRLIRLNFDLITGFSLVPLQLFSMFGMLVSVGAIITYLSVIVDRLLHTGWRAGFSTLWDRDILAFFLLGMVLFGLGLVGEYVGRIYQQVRERPRYTIQTVLERNPGDAAAVTRAVVFAYHNVGVRCLKTLLAHGIDVALAITHEDRPQEQIWFDSVAVTAADYGLLTIAPADPNAAEVLARVAACKPDFLFSFYYRQMLKAPLLALAARGALNMHGSLLPRYRGRAPVNWAIIHGETQTGATLHYMTEKPDAGDIVAQSAVPILPDDTAQEVFDKVTVAAELVLHGGRSPTSLPVPPRAAPRMPLKPAILAGASPRTAPSTGRSRPASFTTWCARSRRRIPARAPDCATGRRAFCAAACATPSRRRRASPSLTIDQGANGRALWRRRRADDSRAGDRRRAGYPRGRWRRSVAASRSPLRD